MACNRSARSPSTTSGRRCASSLPEVQTPTALAAAVRREPDLAGWLSRLPTVVEELAQHWGLSLEPPYQPGGQCAWVAPGGDVVLKVGWRHDEALHEPAALRLWDGEGAV